MRTPSCSVRTLCVLGLAMSASPLFGAAYQGSAYEGFDYTSGAQITNAMAGGTGWNSTGDAGLANTSAWGVLASGTNRTVNATGLNYSDPTYSNETGLAASIVGGNTNVGRNFDQTVDAGTFYFSFLVQKTADSARTLNLSFFSGTNERLAIGQIANNVNLRNPDGSPNTGGTPNTGDFVALISNSQNNAAYNGVYTAAAPINMALNTTFLVVGKVEFGFAGGVEDRLSLYVNPTSLFVEGAPYLQVGINDFGSISAFRVFAGGAQAGPPAFPASAGVFDEIRLSSTYVGATGAIPEPSAFAGIAGACGLLAAAGRRRRRV